MFDNPNKRESLCHAILLYTKQARVGSERFDRNGKLVEKYEPELELKKLLGEHGSFEAIFRHLNGNISLEDFVSRDNRMKYVIKALDGFDSDFRVITANHDEYPEQLRAVEGTSPVIYARGDLSLLEQKSIAVVGTRKIFKETMTKAVNEGNSIVKRLVEAGYAIISGLAEGCDTLAHRQAIKCGGKTIAVLGTSLDDYFPKFNKPLQDIIAKEHLLLSQYPIGIRSFGSYFAHRNKTVASLATEGAVIIHSSDRSGTQYVIHHCQNQGKKLFILYNNFGNGYTWVEQASRYPNSRLVKQFNGGIQ